MFVKLAVLLVYVIMMVTLAMVAHRKSKTLDDFFLGGRKAGPWLSAFAYGTTYFSAVIFIGYAGKTGWEMGLSSMWIALGNAFLGNFLAWHILGRRTRAMTHHLDSKTMPDFFERRFQSRGMKIAAALIIFVFLVPYCASVYQGLSFLFETAFGVPYIYCMLIMALLTAFYLIVGGYGATLLTDFVQGIVMIGGVAVMLGFVIFNPAVGGLTEGVRRLAEIESSLVTVGGPSPWNLFCLVILTSIGSWGMPQMIHKFYAIRDVGAIKQAKLISTGFAVIIAGGAYLNGSLGRLFMNNTVPDAGMDAIVPMMLTRALPEWGIALVVVLVLSASMSTLASLALVSSSAISIDLLKGVFAPKMTQKQTTLVMRILCGVFVLDSFLVASQRFTAVLMLMNFSWATIAGAFLSPFLLGLYWKRTTKAGAWAGMLGGAGISLLLSVIFKVPSAQAGLWAMLGSLALTMVVSLCTKPMDPLHVNHVFAAIMPEKKAGKAA